MMTNEEIEKVADTHIKDNFLTKLGVRRPHLVFVLIMAVALLGFFSLTSMRTEMFPNMDIPFMIVISNVDQNTATPEQLARLTAANTRQNITIPMQQALGRDVSGITEISTVSNPVVSILMVEFSMDVNLITAEMNTLMATLGAGVTAHGFTIPRVIAMSPDMMPVFSFTATHRIYDNDGNLDLERTENWYRENVISELEGHALIAEVQHPFGIGGENNFAYIDEQRAFTFHVQSTAGAVTTSAARAVINILSDIRINYNELDASGNPILLPDSVNFFAENVHILADQGRFINDTIGGVLENLLIGAILCILVLFLFLRSPKLTLAVALSIPLSVIFTFVLMYFMGIGLNLISMSGLALVIGMLVDNSVIVIENIFRLRQKGMSVRDSAIKGASQIFMAVFAATMTTIVIFIPMFFVEGLIMQIFMDLVWVMIFGLSASLVVAVAFLPSIIATLKIGIQQKVDPATLRATPVPPGFKGFLFRIKLFFLPVGIFFGKVSNKMSRGYDKTLNFSLKWKWPVVAIISFLCIGAMILGATANGFELMPTQDTGEFSVNIQINQRYAGTLTPTNQQIQAFLPEYLTNVPLEQSSELIQNSVRFSARRVAETNANNLAGQMQENGYPNYADFRWNNLSPSEQQILINLETPSHLEHVYFDDLHPLVQQGHRNQATNNARAMLQSNFARQLIMGEGPFATEYSIFDIVEDAVGTNNIYNIAIAYNAGGGADLGALFGGGGSSIEINVILRGNRISSSRASNNVFNALSYQFDSRSILADPLDAYDNSFVRGIAASAGFETGMGDSGIEITLTAPDYTSLYPALHHLSMHLLAEHDSQILFIQNNLGLNLDGTLAAIQTTDGQYTGMLTINLRHGVNIGSASGRIDRTVRNFMNDSANDAFFADNDVTRLTGGFADQFTDTMGQMMMALVIGLVLMYLVMVAIFRSFKHPFIILITIPLAFAGGFLALVLTGSPLSMVAMIGMLVLMSVVVNNGIVLVDYINQARHRDGMNVRDAIIAAAKARTRPILMTAFSTILAMIPLAFAGDMMAPLAIVVIGGLTLSTFLSLLVVPAFYAIFNRDKKQRDAAPAAGELVENTSNAELPATTN